jgi:hypothetical protein
VLALWAGGGTVPARVPAKPAALEFALRDADHVTDTILRDPFAGSPSDNAPYPGNDRRNFGAAGITATGTGGSVVVPDIDGSAIERAAPLLTLRATIAGPSPVAYLDDGSGLQIVRVGDVVAGRNVARIDLRGLAFADGTRVDLPDATPSSATAATPQPATGRRRDASRTNASRALSGAMPGVSPAAPAPPILPAPGPSASPETYPTPAPLRTADSRGLAPGVNPTPDTTGPTAFPYPYPYAPHP